MDARILASELVNYFPLFCPIKAPINRLLDAENDKSKLFNLNSLFFITQRSSIRSNTSDEEEDSF